MNRQIKSICGLEHLYDDRRCVLPTGHEFAPAWTPHQAADGFRWDYHEETYAEGTPDEGVEQWDELVDYKPAAPSTYSRSALFDRTGILLNEHTFSPAIVLKAGERVQLTMTIGF